MAVKHMPVGPVTANAADRGPVTRAVQDVTGAAEALTLGAVHLTRNTLTAAVETVEDVGGRIGSLAVTTVRGATKAVSDIGGDLGEFAKGTVQATRELGGEVGALAVEAAEGAVLAVDRIGSAAGRSLRDALTSTVSGVKTVLTEVGVTGAVPRRPEAQASETARRPLARVTRSKRSAPARKTA